MTTLEIILFIILATWMGAVVMRADKLIKDIHERLKELENEIRNK